jgi:transcriptional regulator with XRE-family HTH domain
MASAGLGVRALAQRSRVDKGTISAWRSGGQTKVRVETAGKVAAALGTSVEHLLDMPPARLRGSPAPPPEQVRLLRRMVALAPAIEAAEEPTTDLSQALAVSEARLASLEDLLLQLKKLADEARAAGGL